MEKHFHISVFSPAKGKLASVFSDITSRKGVEADREALIRELEAKNAELEHFTCTVSHDLKSPLITIRGFLSRLEKDAAQGNFEHMKSDINRISGAAERMQRLLEELLELSRVGRQANPPEEMSFAQLAQGAVAAVAGRLAERDVRVEIASDLPTIYADPVRIQELLENLLDNAAKFMGDQSKPQVKIGAGRNGGETVFYVRDNGVGIDPRHREKVFDIFNKLDRNTEGTGVGLAIVKRIVDVHGGRIWVESEGKGKGTALCFTIPDKRRGARSGAIS